MKRLLALLLALSVIIVANPQTYAVRDDEKDKKEDKKDAVKKDSEKKDGDKKDGDKKETEDKLTDEQKKELEKLSGTFTVTTFERDGKKAPADELKKMKVVQKMAEWTFSLGDDATTGKDVIVTGKDPKQIDSTYTNGPARGKTVKGIYKIDGDTVTYCWAEPDQDRPTAFVTKADSNLTLMVLKRTAEKEKDGKKDGEKDGEKKDGEKKDGEKKDGEKKDGEKDKDK